SRIRKETIAAEDILHDLGALSIISSDSQAMGRVGEVIIRTWQTADKMKKQFGYLAEEQGENDNFRARRYVSKYTINPAIAQGISTYVGSIEIGKLADICIWDPAFFGVKPDMVIKSGTIAAAIMGDPNGSIPNPQPEYYRLMFGAFGGSLTESSVTFVSQALLNKNYTLGLRSRQPSIGTKTGSSIHRVRPASGFLLVAQSKATRRTGLVQNSGRIPPRRSRLGTNDL